MQPVPYQPNQQPKRVLLTGARGFVGSYLHAAMAARRPRTEIVALTKQTRGPGLVPVDLLNQAAVNALVAETRPDLILHLAGQASVARGSREISETWSVNVSGSLNLATAVARHAPEATLLFASSSEIYGASFLNGRVAEETPTLPMTSYARSKAIAEQIFLDVLPASAKLIIVRPFNHTGPGQREDFALPSFVSQIARMETGRQSPRLEVGNLDFSRDFLDVRDVVEAYLALVEAAPRLPRCFRCNLGSDNVRPLREYVAALGELSHVPFKIVVDPSRLRAADIPIAAGDSRLLRAVTGWRPKYAMQDTLLAMLEAAREAESDAYFRPAARSS